MIFNGDRVLWMLSFFPNICNCFGNLAIIRIDARNAPGPICYGNGTYFGPSVYIHVWVTILGMHLGIAWWPGWEGISGVDERLVSRPISFKVWRGRCSGV